MKNYVEKVRQKMEERRQLKRIKLNLIEANIKELKIDGKTKYANVLSVLNSMLLEYLAKDEYFSEMRVLNFVSDISCYMADNVGNNTNTDNKVGERIELILKAFRDFNKEHTEYIGETTDLGDYLDFVEHFYKDYSSIENCDTNVLEYLEFVIVSQYSCCKLLLATEVE